MDWLNHDVIGLIAEKCTISDVCNLSRTCKYINQICQSYLPQKRQNIKVFYGYGYCIFRDSNLHYYYFTKTYKIQRLDLKVGDVKDLKLVVTGETGITLYILHQNHKLSSINGTMNKFLIIKLDEKSYQYDIRPDLTINSIASYINNFYIATQHCIYINRHIFHTELDIIKIYSHCSVLTNKGWRLLECDFGSTYQFYNNDIIGVGYAIENGDMGGKIKNNTPFATLKNNQVVNYSGVVLLTDPSFLQIYSFQNSLILFTMNYELKLYIKTKTENQYAQMIRVKL